MPIDAIVEQPSEADDKRGTTRWRIRLEVPGSLNDERANVVIHDISTAGMLIETRSKLEVGQDIAVSLPEAENVTANIVWQDEPLFGCRFDKPLPQAALSAARLRNPVRSSADPIAVEPQSRVPEMLPARLRRLRRERGLSRTALSERTGFSKPTLWAWETGKTTPRRTNLLILAEIFGLTEQQLLLGENIVQQTERTTAQSASERISAAVDLAKSQIAQIAGVDKSMVHIYIEY